MVTFYNTRSTAKPPDVDIKDTAVFVAEDIISISEAGTDDMPGFEGYEYTLTQYGKDEYIQTLHDKNTALEAEITQTQEALCDVYELVGV